MDSREQFGDVFDGKKTSHNDRYDITMKYMNKYITKDKKILDLGVYNPLSELMIKDGYQVDNTEVGVDLDLDMSVVQGKNYDVITAFEIFEHMLAPFNILRETTADFLVASVPLKLWFANAYWNEEVEWDRHYHEFEPRQFDMLLGRTGWKIIDSHKWAVKSNKIGVRPILRRTTPRYYLVVCERVK